jgi:hypothetical protein
MRLSLQAALLWTTATVAGGGAVAQTGEPIGSTMVVVNRVTAELAHQARTLQTGDDVRQDDLIEVSSDGLSELKLLDETKLALGPGARLLLDKFVYDSQKTRGSIVVELVKGSFRFITGLAAKPSYLVRVPNASITVRGTIFDVYVQENGVVWLLLHEGVVRVCDSRGRCRELAEPGRLIRIADGAVGPPSRWTALPGRQNIVFDNAFPFVGTAPGIDPIPHITREAIVRDRPPRPPRGRGGDDHPPKSVAPRRKARVEHAQPGTHHSKGGTHYFARRGMFSRGRRR